MSRDTAKVECHTNLVRDLKSQAIINTDSDAYARYMARKIKQKETESFSGAINEMIDSAPKNLAQVESEIMTIRQEAIKKGMTEEQVKPLLARLESEKDLLKLASKYGHLAKPLGGSVGKILEKVLGGIGN